MKRKNPEAELYRCKKHLKRLIEAQSLYKKEVERKARELDRARKILQQTLDSLEVGILVLDTDMKVAFINRSLKELFGVEDDVYGRFCWEALHKLDAPCSGEKCRLALERGEKIEEELIFLKDGKKRYYLVRTHPWQFEGKTAGIVRTFIDITDRKIAEEYELLSGISMYMAHVVKNSITPVGGFVKRISKECENEENREVFEYIFESLLKLERSMFEYESYVLMKRKAPYELFDLGRALERLCEELSSSAFGKEFFLEHLRGEYEVVCRPTDESVRILGNEGFFLLALKHLVATLISYGVEELGVEKVEVEVEGRRSDNDFVLEISFNYAIPVEVRELLFEPWRRDKGRSFDKWGFAICKEMVDYHEGSVKLSSGGSLCRVILPVKSYHY